MVESLAWKILLIDDDEEDFMITRDMLRETNSRRVELHWAATYQDGLSRLSKSPAYDAVLVDYDLGARTGLDLVREVITQGCRCPLILLTGRGSYEVDVEAMQAGVRLYLTKNEVNPLLLERSIRYAIEMKRQEQILLNQNGRLKLLSDLSAQLLQNNHPVELLDHVSQRLSRLSDLDVYVHYQRSVNGSYLNLAAIGGYPDEIRVQLRRLEYGQAVCGTVARTGQAMVVQDVQHSTDERTRLIRRLGICAYACHPLIVRGRVFGTLSFGSRTRSELDEETIDLLRTICDLIAVAYERRELEQARAKKKANRWLRETKGTIRLNP